MTLEKKIMSLKNLLHTRLVEQFNNAKIKGSGALSPRNGYYFIHSVDYQEIKKKGKFPIARVLWKSNNADLFIKDCFFEISLSSLRLADPLDYKNLANKIILIDDVMLVQTFNLDNALEIECKYQVINRRPFFTTLQNLVLSVFFGNAPSIGEAYRNYEKDLNVDLSDAIYWEDRSDDAYDAQIDDDVYDAYTEDNDIK